MPTSTLDPSLPTLFTGEEGKKERKKKLVGAHVEDKVSLLYIGGSLTKLKDFSFIDKVGKFKV